MKRFKASKHIIALTAALVFTFGIWVGDVVYDQSAVPKKAIAVCGQGNVASVSTQGLFKTDIRCASKPADVN